MSNKEKAKLYTDENRTRIVAAQVTILTVITLITQWKFPAFLLAVDFALRAFTSQPSPLAAVAKVIVHLSELKPKPIFAAPKKFAAALGFVFSLAVLILLYAKLVTGAYIVGGILILCAILESVFRMCLGCYVYNWVIVPIGNKIQKKY
ncbi:MAG: DUF4395 domain-containing protein [Mangrovibacterium sp.]